MSVGRNHRGKWSVDIVYEHPDGRVQRIQKTSPVQTRRGAEEYDRQVRAALLAGAYGRAREEEQEKAPALRDFAGVFMEVRVSKNKRSTRNTYRYALDGHILPRYGDRRLDGIGVLEVDTLRTELNHSGLSPKAVNNILGVLRALLRYAAKVGKVKAAPQFEMNKVGDQGFDFLDFEEYAKLVAAQSIEEHLIVVLLGGEAGLRRSEIAGLWWEDVDLKSGQLKVQRQLLEGELLIPKGGKPRTIPLTARLSKALRAYRHLRSKHVLVREGNTPWTASTFKWRAETIYAAAALPRFVGKETPHPAQPWHCLRHTFCSHLAMRGCPPATLQALAGHSDIRTTMRYIHLAPRALCDAIALLNSVEREPDVNGLLRREEEKEAPCRRAENGLTIGAGSAR